MKNEKKRWIVWNNTDKGEGVIFDNQDDAETAANGKHQYKPSTLAETFNEYYGDNGDLSIEEIDFAAIDPRRDEAIWDALKTVISAVGDHLVPDGISKEELINRVIEATDNERINAALADGKD